MSPRNKDDKSYIFSKTFMKDKDTLASLIKMLNEELEFKLINESFIMDYSDNMYINKYGTLEDNYNRLLSCKDKYEIHDILMNISIILSQLQIYVATYNYVPLIEFLYKNTSYNEYLSKYTYETYRVSNEMNIANINDDNKIGKCFVLVAHDILKSNMYHFKSMESELDSNKIISYMEVCKQNIENKINYFKREVPRKILFVTDFAITLKKSI